MDFSNLLLVCSDIVPKLGSTNGRSFFSTVGTLHGFCLKTS